MFVGQQPEPVHLKACSRDASQGELAHREAMRGLIRRADLFQTGLVSFDYWVKLPVHQSMPVGSIETCP